MPGSIAAYRRGLLVELGGFGQGFNGEDSDITMRIGRLGYRIVTDPGVRVWTECPGTLAQLREQRQRWTRGRFHMASRNRSCVSMRQGVRGVWMLPASLFTACRRCLMVPLLAGATVVEMLDPGVFSLREVFAVVRILAGFQVAVAIAVLVAHRQYRALPYVPLTLGYRLFLAYVAFETVLTLVGTPRRRSALSSPAVSLAPRLQPAIAMNPHGGRS
jgi:cellulose synthase/poly-beta-1,6-N-acetylglucosamine synthase-like glycosyltransferase